MSDVVETKPNVSIFEIPYKSNNNNNAQAQEQEVKDCTQFLNIEYTKFRQYKLILECIEEIIEGEKNDNLEPELRMKIKKIILDQQVSQTRQTERLIGNGECLENVLGVPMCNTTLTYSESNKLHCSLRYKLDSKFTNLKNKCYSLFDKDFSTFEKNESPMELAQDDIILLDNKNKLTMEQEAYVKNQLTMLELLEELKNIRVNIVSEVSDQNYKKYKLESHLNYLKSQLASVRCRIDIFMESSNSLQSYSELLKDMLEQREEIMQEIERLKDLKKKYDDVSCKEYNDILKSYLQYKSALEKKKLMYELYR